MKKLIVMLLTFIILGGALFIYHQAATLPIGKLIRTSSSPNGNYAIMAYLCDGGATTDQAIRAEVLDAASGRVRNIYWQYHAYDAEITWLSDTLVRINDIELDVRSDSYDYRSHI